MQSRTRATAALAGIALLAGGTAFASNASAATKAKAVTCAKGTEIDYVGPITGPNGNLGVNISRGADLAIAEFNKANKGCQIVYKTQDTQGDPDQAILVVPKVISNKKVIGVVGPAFSGETDKTGKLFADALLPSISPSATRVSLSSNGWATFHRALANDGKQGPGIAKQISVLGGKKVGIIDDQSDYGKGLADIVKSTLGAAVVASDSFNDKATDFSAAITKMKSGGVDAIFFGGYYAQAGPLTKAIRAAGLTATVVFGDGVLDQGYIDGAGPDGEGAIITCTCAPTDANPTFLASYKAKFNDTPKTYGPEAYDAANALLDGIKAGKTTRKALNDYLKTYNKQGVTKVLKWDATGEVAGEAVYAYKVVSGKITPLGLIK